MADNSKKEHLYYCFSGLAVIHIVLGCIALAVSVAGIGIDASYIDKLEEKGQNVKYIVIGLDASSVVASLWFMVSGLMTCSMTCCGASLIKMKVSTMVCSILAASVFSPIMIGSAVTGYILRGNDYRKFLVVPAVLTGLAVMEMLFSIFTAISSCKTTWHVKRHKDDNVQIETDIERNARKEKKQKMSKKEEKEQKKILKTEEKTQRKAAEKENGENRTAIKREEKENKKREKSKEKYGKVRIAFVDDSDLAEIVLGEHYETGISPPPPEIVLGEHYETAISPPPPYTI